MKTISGNKQDKKRSSISACMIVKNEETFLPRCLASIRDLVDEIILVDTGSDDRTVEVATEYGCRVFNFSWTGDFSAARNESLRYAESDWILIIDADEEIPAEEIDSIREAVNNPAHEIISISVYNKSLESGQVSSFLPSVRLFRRQLELKYDGIVHNRLMLPRDKQVIRRDIKLFHYGYDLSTQELEQKKKRSIELLEKQLRENPDDVFANFNMAQLLRGMNGVSDPDTCRRIIQHATQVIDHPDSESTGYAGYRIMAHIQAAIAYSAIGRFEEAESYCLAALSERPDYVDAAITLANVYLATGKIEQARKYYRRYLDMLDSYRPEEETSDIILHYLDTRQVAWYGLATIARINRETEQALKYYNRIISAGHRYLDTYYQAGIIYLQQGDPRRAQDILDQELTHNGDSVAAHLAMAQALSGQAKGDYALPHLDSALAIEPGNVPVRLFRARILLAAGSGEKSLDDVRKIMKDVPDNAGVLFECGNILFAAGRIREAQACYLKVKDLQPDHCEAMNNLGNCSFRLEEYDQAVAIYEQLIQDSSEFRTAYRNLGMAYIRLEKNEKALNVLAQYVDHSPEDIEVFRIIGDLLSSLGYHDKAIGCYEKYLRHHPDDSACLLNLAEIYFQLGHREAAEAGYRQVLASDPSCRPAQKRLESISATEATC